MTLTSIIGGRGHISSSIRPASVTFGARFGTSLLLPLCLCWKSLRRWQDHLSSKITIQDTVRRAAVDRKPWRKEVKASPDGQGVWKTVRLVLSAREKRWRKLHSLAKRLLCHSNISSVLTAGFTSLISSHRLTKTTAHQFLSAACQDGRNISVVGSSACEISACLTF